jgi:tryptophanyl-tRNA synthetase
MRILSGIQPSGELHIGNYFGMIKRMVENQQNGELFAFIVNYHAMTSLSDGKALRTNTLNAAVNMLSLGIDPEKSVFWAQSDLHCVARLWKPMGESLC